MGWKRAGLGKFGSMIFFALLADFFDIFAVSIIWPPSSTLGRSQVQTCGKTTGGGVSPKPFSSQPRAVHNRQDFF